MRVHPNHPVDDDGRVDEFLRFGDREFIGCETLRNVDAARGCIRQRLRIDDLEVRAILSDAERHVIREHDRVDGLGVDVTHVVDDVAKAAVLLAAEVEAREPVDAILLAIGDAVEVVFHAGGEVVLHEIREVVLEQAHHGKCDPVRHECRAARSHVPAVDDGRDDRGVGRRATDSELLERLDETGLRVARRGTGLVTLGFDIRNRELLTDGEGRKFCLGWLRRVVALLVAALLVGLQEAAEGDDRAARGELGHRRALHRASRDDDGCRRSFRVGHLRGDRALPDQVVELPVVATKHTLELPWRTEGVAGGADGLVGFLSILALARVHSRLVRHALGAIERTRLRSRGRDCLLREVERVGTHIGDVAVLVQPLRNAHCLASGEAKFARRLLLQGRGAERGRGPTGVRLRVNRGDDDGDRRVAKRLGERLGGLLVECNRIRSLGGACRRLQLALVVEVAPGGNAGAIEPREARLELSRMVG